MNNKTAPLVIIIVTILVITAVVWLILWQSIKPTNQNQNVNQINTNQSDQGIVYFELDKEFWMKKGQIGQLRSENLEIELMGITYSPCPKGAMCEVSGLGANIEVNKGTESKELSLVLSETVTVFRFEINLFQVQQDKVSFIVKKTQKLTLSTNKIVYQKGEEVKITIDNNSSDDVVIKYPYYEIRSAGSTDEKDKIQIVRCPCGALCKTMAPYLTLKKGEKLEYTWNQANQRCEGDNQINEQVPVGSYRAISYLKNDKEWQDFIYADFTIREKSAEVTIATDKTLYQKGEEVKITVTNNLSQKIGFEPSFSPAFGSAKIYQKDSHGEWQIIYNNMQEPDVAPPSEARDWSIILNPEEQHSFAWDQKAIVQGPGSQRIQVSQGIYRVQLYWSTPKTYKTLENGNVYSNEFTIKEQITCGGFGGIKCPDGYYCYIEKQLVADASGVCRSKEEKACQTDADCVLTQASCCPCSKGGTTTCLNKNFKDVFTDSLKCAQKDMECPTFYLCDNQPTTCVCQNNQCEGIRPSAATNVNK